MAYFKINDVDYSPYVKELIIDTNHTYNSQTNAAGDTVVDYVSTKRMISVGIIPISADIMAQLRSALDAFNVSLSFRNPTTNELETDVNCIIPTDSVEYFTIRANNVSYKEFKLEFIEL